MTTHDATRSAADGLTSLRRALRMAVLTYVGGMLASLPRRLTLRCDGLHPCCRQ